VHKISPPPALELRPVQPVLSYSGPLKVKDRKKKSWTVSVRVVRVLTVACPPKFPEFKAAVLAGASHHPVSA